jgi:hypothetical protein
MLAVEGHPFVSGMQGIDTALMSFLYPCFIAHLEYPPVIHIIIIFI